MSIRVSSVLSLVLMCLLSGSLYAGGYKSSIKKGDLKYLKGEFEFAIEFYKRALDKGGPVAQLNYKIADCYRVSNRLIDAVPFYKNAVDAGIENDSALFYCGVGLKMKGEFLNSQSYFKRYAESGSNESLVNRAALEVKNYPQLKTLLEEKPHFEVNNAEFINTTGAEYSPYWHEGKIYFSTSRGQSKMYRVNGQGFSDIYEYVFDGFDATSGQAKPIGYKVNEDETHEACFAISPDGNTIVYAKSNDGRKKGPKGTNLYITRHVKGEWSEPEMINVSVPDAWDSSPCFSSDGITLYFSSDRKFKGAYGGADLYSTTMNPKNGRFGRVKNLGSAINTAGDEVFPYATPGGRLFFASNGHYGLGGLDLFVAERDSTGAIVIENLGAPVNSSYDDFGITYKDSRVGYFSSNRPGGKGDDDIYVFKDITPEVKIVNYFLECQVIEDIEVDGQDDIPLPGTHVKILDNATGQLIFEGRADEEGRFKLPVETEKKYTIIADKDSFFTKREIYSTMGKTIPLAGLKDHVNEIDFQHILEMDRIVMQKEIVMENIYYDYNSSEIREDAAAELDKLVDLLNDNPNISIELGSHTDDRGKADYNLKLSQSRADAAKQYIISKGIETSRVKARGHGKEDPIIPGAKTEAEHQKNRRTEFKVTKVN